MGKSKKQPIKQKKKKPSQNGTNIPTKHLPSHEDPWFSSIFFAPLVVGSITAAGLIEPAMLQFSLLLFPLIVAHYLGASFLNKGEESLNHAKLFSFAILELILLGGHYYVTHSVITTFLLGAVVIFTGVLRGTVPKSIFMLLLHCMMAIVSMSLLAILGVFSQSEKLILSTSVLGFVSGSILSASLIAQYASIFERRGYKRSLTRDELSPFVERLIAFGEKLRRKKLSSSSATFPGFPARLYTIFLMAIPCLIIMLIPLGLFPLSLLFMALTQFPAPRLATAFMNKEVVDEAIYRSSVRLAAINTAFAVAGGLLSR